MNNEESVIVPNIYMKRPTYTYEIERGIIVESGGGGYGLLGWENLEENKAALSCGGNDSCGRAQMMLKEWKNPPITCSSKSL